MRIPALALVLSGLSTTIGLAQTPVVTEHGYPFVQHRDLGRPHARYGETALANVYIWAGDTLLSDSRTTPSGVYRFDLPDSLDAATAEHTPPLVDAFLRLGIGDSASIWQPIDDYMRKFIPKRAKNETHIRFDIQMIDVVTREAKIKAQAEAKKAADAVRDRCLAKIQAYRSGLLNQQVQTLPSGLSVYLESQGAGQRVQEGDLVKMHYYGFLSDGTPFDNTYERRQRLPAPVGSGQLIAGLEQGLLLLNRGAKAYFFVPAYLAYGEQGSDKIPPNTDLIFFVDVL